MYTFLFYSLIAVIFGSIITTLMYDEVVSAFYFFYDALTGNLKLQRR